MGSGYDSRNKCDKKGLTRGKDYAEWHKKGGRHAFGLGTGNKKKKEKK